MDTIFILGAFLIAWLGGHALNDVAVRLSRVSWKSLGINTRTMPVNAQQGLESRAIVETVAHDRRSWKIAR